MVTKNMKNRGPVIMMMMRGRPSWHVPGGRFESMSGRLVGAGYDDDDDYVGPIFIVDSGAKTG